MKAGSQGGALSLLLPALAVSALLFVLPLGAVVQASLTGSGAHFVRFFGDPYYLDALGVTLATAALVTILAAAVSYPAAIAFWQASPRARALLTVMLLSPFYASVTVKVFGWMVLLPTWLRESYWAIVIIDVHRSIPFMVLLLSTALTRIDPEVLEAARVCGAGPLRTVWRVIVPLTLPAAVSAGILVFSLTSASFVVPLLVGGPAGSRFLPVVMYQQFTVAQNWGFGSAIAMILLATATAAVLAAHRLVGRSSVSAVATEPHGA
jgi:ABC-type spermidine/putrescine transport system permease subunit I